MRENRRSFRFHDLDALVGAPSPRKRLFLSDSDFVVVGEVMSAVSRRSAASTARGVTLVELIIWLLVIGILVGGSAALGGQFLRLIVYFPKAVAAHRVAADVLHHIVEGGPSTLGVGSSYGPQIELRGLRHATRLLATEGAVWLAQPGEIGFRTSAGQCIVIRLSGGVIKRSAVLAPSTSPCRTTPRSAEEDIPADGAGDVTMTIPTGRLFRYYNQSGAVVPDGTPYPGTVRRVEITFVAQTGTGVFEDGEARIEKASSVTLRIR